MTATTHYETAPHAAQDRARSEASLTLDGLLDMDCAALQALYEGARVPRLSDVRGDLRGRMLAWPAMKPPVSTAVRRFAGSRVFPWRGKSFSPMGEDRGEGINRVVRDRIRLYRFETYVGRSRAGDFDCVQLNYDLPENPFFIRPVKDEIREIAPKLYLGQAYLQLKAKTHLVLYFGLSG